jgi:hypothetical protein
VTLEPLLTAPLPTQPNRFLIAKGSSAAQSFEQAAAQSFEQAAAQSFEEEVGQANCDYLRNLAIKSNCSEAIARKAAKKFVKIRETKFFASAHLDIVKAVPFLLVTRLENVTLKMKNVAMFADVNLRLLGVSFKKLCKELGISGNPTTMTALIEMHCDSLGSII